MRIALLKLLSPTRKPNMDPNDWGLFVATFVQLDLHILVRGLAARFPHS